MDIINNILSFLQDPNNFDDLINLFMLCFQILVIMVSMSMLHNHCDFKWQEIIHLTILILLAHFMLFCLMPVWKVLILHLLQMKLGALSYKCFSLLLYFLTSLLPFAAVVVSMWDLCWEALKSKSEGEGDGESQNNNNDDVDPEEENQYKMSSMLKAYHSEIKSWFIVSLGMIFYIFHVFVPMGTTYYMPCEALTNYESQFMCPCHKVVLLEVFLGVSIMASFLSIISEPKALKPFDSFTSDMVFICCIVCLNLLTQVELMYMLQVHIMVFKSDCIGGLMNFEFVMKKTVSPLYQWMIMKFFS